MRKHILDNIDQWPTAKWSPVGRASARQTANEWHRCFHDSRLNFHFNQLAIYHFSVSMGFSVDSFRFLLLLLFCTILKSCSVISYYYTGLWPKHLFGAVHFFSLLILAFLQLQQQQQQQQLAKKICWTLTCRILPTYTIAYVGMKS